jgi:pyruvate,water dikinase
VELRDVNLTTLNDVELDEYIAETIALFEEGNKIHFLLHAAYGGFLGRMVLTCHDLLGWEEGKVFEMLNGLSQKSTEPSRRLADLARIVQENQKLRSLVQDIDYDTLDRLTEADAQFGAAFREYLHEYGCRALRYEIGDLTLAETPTLVLGFIYTLLLRGYDPAADASALKHKRRSTVEKARADLSRRSSQERELFEKLLAQAEQAYPVREDNEFYTLGVPVALIRYGVLEIGRRLAERGQIGERDDVFFLKIEEARRELRDGGDMLRLVRRRKGERTWVLAHPGPATYGEYTGPPPDFSVLPTEARIVMESALWYMDRNFAQEHSRKAEATGGELRGIAASPGKFQGAVRVIMDESELGKVKARDVLVCPITSPVWTVMFPSIGALVTDTGGILSHSAIIAREYRVPAVVGTGRATRVLRDGQIVKVDGTAGTVERVG